MKNKIWMTLLLTIGSILLLICLIVLPYYLENHTQELYYDELYHNTSVEDSAHLDYLTKYNNYEFKAFNFFMIMLTSGLFGMLSIGYGIYFAIRYKQEQIKISQETMKQDKTDANNSINKQNNDNTKQLHLIETSLSHRFDASIDFYQKWKNITESEVLYLMSIYNQNTMHYTTFVTRGSRINNLIDKGYIYKDIYRNQIEFIVLTDKGITLCEDYKKI